MNEMQHTKFVTAIAPAAIIDDASATATVIDCRGYDYLSIPVQFGATDIAVTALKLQNSSTSGGTYADISGATFDGGTGAYGDTLTLPTATDDNKPFLFQVDMRGKNPFVKVVVTFGNGAAGGFVSATAVLSNKSNGSTNSTGTDQAAGKVCRVL